MPLDPLAAAGDEEATLCNHLDTLLKLHRRSEIKPADTLAALNEGLRLRHVSEWFGTLEDLMKSKG
ncbi:MAG: hypothetical protein VKO21_04665 [Candidatus Sericytochromatia bacterium]|nr:hypothetical protein [Candidatus Sericytochromatia bacterium]